MSKKGKQGSKPCTVEELAAVQFAPLPEAKELGWDRQRCAKSAERQRQQ